MHDKDGSCYLPIYGMPPPNEGTLNSFTTLEKEKYTWHVGTKIMDLYLVVFDNTPSINNPGLNSNLIGISACTSHKYQGLEDEESARLRNGFLIITYLYK